MNVAFKNVEADRRGAQSSTADWSFMLEIHPRLPSGSVPPTVGSDPEGVSN